MAKRQGKVATLARRVRQAAGQVGATVEFVSIGRCYVTAPTGKVWAIDPGVHSLMIINHPEDIEMGIGWIERGLVDCPATGCDFCGRRAAAEKEANLRVGLDSACL